MHLMLLQTSKMITRVWRFVSVIIGNKEETTLQNNVQEIFGIFNCCSSNKNLFSSLTSYHLELKYIYVLRQSVQFFIVYGRLSYSIDNSWKCVPLTIPFLLHSSIHILKYDKLNFNILFHMNSNGLVEHSEMVQCAVCFFLQKYVLYSQGFNFAGENGENVYIHFSRVMC